ncbi:MAG: DUF452 family protein [Barnesiella sp.]|nr:DUF452 family protein [Barnesiella sp.]
MIQKYLQRECRDVTATDTVPSPRRLILFFAGWGMDASGFASLSKPGYDIMVVYDYRNEDFDATLLDGYDEICVLAWSLGVWHADRFISTHPRLPVTRTIAVNGTLSPISADYGIPPRIYDLTAKLPDEGALQKFYRRICGGESMMQSLMPKRPQRGVDELRDELLAVRARIPVDGALDTANWDEIYLSDSDLIFPFDNMKRAWEGATERVRVMHGAHHAIDFSSFMAGAFVDKLLVGDRFATATPSYEREAEVQRRVADRMIAAALPRLTVTDGLAIVEAGSGPGVLTKRYLPSLSNSRVELWDLAPSAVTAADGNRVEVKACDAEMQLRRVPDNSIDIFFSSSTIQWFNSPRRFLREVVRALAPGGQAFISCYVEGTIPQLSQLPGASAMHYPQVDDVLESLPAAECDTFTEEFSLEFDTAAQALAHMRSTGVNSLARKAMPVAATRRLMQLLTEGDKAILKFNTKFILIRKNG